MGKRARKLEQNMELKTKGYMTRVESMVAKVDQLWNEREKAVHEIEVFSTLRETEIAASKSRVEELRENVDKEKSRNKELQARYAKLSRMRAELEAALE